MERKATWRVSCETCRKNGKRFHCTWRFHSELGARAQIETIREVDSKGWRIYTPSSGMCLQAETHDVVLEHWDGERWVVQDE